MRKAKPKPHPGRKITRKKRPWRFITIGLFIPGTIIAAVWLFWLDYAVRQDFNALQWELPARLYARPLELYAGARVSQAALTDYLQRLGYRNRQEVAGPGEFQTSGSRINLWTRGFDFWDGKEQPLHLTVEFDGSTVYALWGDQNTGDLALARLEPVEIARINANTGEDRLPVNFEDVPKALVDAVIAVEDKRFYSHIGVDFLGIARAFVANIKAGEIVQGGSTLTQQLVKNLYLNRQQTLRRKIEEAFMALSLELHFSKEKILTAYLNEVFLGQQGNRAIHGFALAAEFYFARPLNELSLAELATLAGVSRGASYYNPHRYPERAVQRRDVVLTLMKDQSYINQAEFELARQDELKVSTRPSGQRFSYPAFTELVGVNLARDYDRDALRTEGLRIFTTLDLTVQDAMEARLEDAVKAVERESASSGDAHLEAAMVITDAITGEVRAIAGGRQRGYVGFNRALNAVRPIGSLVKPAIYLAALESREYSLASVLADFPVTLRLDGGREWSPANYEDKIYGNVYLYDALERSMNLATVNLGMELGVDKTAKMLERLGYSKNIPLYPSLLLGAIDMAPIEVAQLYQTLASNGFRSPLRTVEAVTTGQGVPLERYGFETMQVADHLSMNLLEYAMQGVFTRGTAKTMAGRLDNHLPLSGKTGTTNDLRDSWFAGYGDDLVGVVWLGYDDNRGTGLTGATGALRVWTEVMTGLNIQPRLNQAPENIVWNNVSYAAVTNSQQRDCRDQVSLPFALGTPPPDAVHCAEKESFFRNILDRVRGIEQ